MYLFCCINSNPLSYNTVLKSWHSICPMQNKRYVPAIALMNDRIYVAGGLNGASTLKSAEYYDQGTNKWITISSMNRTHIGFALAPLNGFLYAVAHKCSVERYDPKEDIWSMAC